jgi:hypothetical protein
MRSGTRHVFRNILLGMLSIVLLTGLVAYSEGAVMVSVRERKPEGTRIWLPVPALLVEIGMRFVPAEQLRDASAQIRPWLPAIRAASTELERCPDATLVAVESRTEQVQVSKRGDSMQIDVQNEEETVHVSVPVEFVNSMAEEIGARGTPN